MCWCSDEESMSLRLSIRLLCAFCCFGLGAAPVHSQAAPAPGSAAPPESAAPVPVAPPNSTGQLLHRSLQQEAERQQQRRFITLKVVVTDSSGKAVAGLKESDFSVLDRGLASAVTGFRAVNAAHPHLPDRLVLLLDLVNDNFTDVAYERKGLGDYLHAAGPRLPYPTSLIVLTDTGVGVGKASQDPAALLEDLKHVPGAIRENGGAEGAEGLLRRFQVSLRAFGSLVTYESTLPGRATMIWFGPGWPLLESGRTFVSSERNKQSYFDTLVNVTNRMREGGVTVDNIGPAALTWGGERRADVYQAFLAPVLTAKATESSNLALPVFTLHSGGVLLRQTGSIPQEIGVCLEDMDTYYTLTLALPRDVGTDEYHPLQVSVATAGLTVRTSAGYYAEP